MAAPSHVQITHRARRDLERLEDFLKDAGDPAAPELVDFIFEALRVLTHQPGIGRPVDDGLRELIVHRGHSGYLARYQWLPEFGRVLVLRIRHQRESGYTDDEV